MKDLMFSYNNANGKRIYKEYDTIMDFLSGITDYFDDKSIYCTNVNARFWEDPLRDKEFETVEDLYLHCRAVCL